MQCTQLGRRPKAFLLPVCPCYAMALAWGKCKSFNTRKSFHMQVLGERKNTNIECVLLMFADNKLEYRYVEKSKHKT